MKIVKFGGTSVGSADALKKVVSILSETLNSKEIQAVVVSAFSGVTNQLIDMARLAEAGDDSWMELHKSVENRHIAAVSDLFPAQSRSGIIAQVLRLSNEFDEVLNGISQLGECSDRSLDRVMSFGERLSAYIVKELLEINGIPARCLDAREVLETNRNFGNAQLNITVTEAKIQAYFKENPGLAVVTGFIASSPKGETTTLGRGGSDYTAAILASAMQASEILIYTDVNGMMTADPRTVKQAFTIGQISYEEAMELSHFGAKVIYPPTLLPAIDKKIPIRILNTFEPEHPGTLITHESGLNSHLITGLSSIKEVSLVNVQGSGLVGVAGFAGRLFTALARDQINIILITQASSEHSISFAVSPADTLKTESAIAAEFSMELLQGQLEPLDIQHDASILAIVGERMKQTPGVSGKLFSALGRNGINVVATAQGSSELNISVVVRRNDLSKALNALHQIFFTGDLNYLHLFLLGPGLIGKTLLNQIQKQLDFLHTNRLLNIKLIGIANSTKMRIDPEGIPIAEWPQTLKSQGEPTNIENWVEQITALNLPNSVVVDCTAQAILIPYYGRIFSKSIAIVTPNKMANSGPYSLYKDLHEKALHNNTRFCYETNVGAGLPVIQTLRNLIQSGDQIHRIEAMLSGTLSFIFNRFQPGIPFWKVVAEAKELGYTEPDPRDDLSGRDIARKILILARETGLAMEPEEIVPDNMLPPACVNAKTVDAFFESLKDENEWFETLLQKAVEAGKKIKFICKLEDGKVSLKLEQIGPDHPFWNSSGADNILAFYTTRYSERPMVIQGPGAGAEVTAAGVFGEIIGLGQSS